MQLLGISYAMKYTYTITKFQLFQVYKIDESSYLLPSDSGSRSSNCSGCETNGFSFLHGRCCKSFNEFRSQNLFLFDDVQIALEGRFASLVSSHARNNSAVRSTNIRYHERVATAFVDQNFVRRVVGHGETVDIPRDLGIWSSSYATVEPTAIIVIRFNIFTLTTLIFS